MSLKVGSIGGNAWIYKLYTENQGKVSAKLRNTPQTLSEAVKVTISEEAKALYKAANPGMTSAGNKLGDD